MRQSGLFCRMVRVKSGQITIFNTNGRFLVAIFPVEEHGAQYNRWVQISKGKGGPPVWK